MVAVSEKLSSPMLPVNMDGSYISQERYRAPHPEVMYARTFEEATRLAKPEIHRFARIKELSTFIVYSKEYAIHIPPKQHTDKEGNIISDAFYYIEQRVDGGVIYLSYLPPFGKTSRPHGHSWDM